MKKTILFIAVVAAVSFASCKKDRTCTCTTSYSDGSPSDTQVYTIKEASKGTAKKACIDRTYTSPGYTETTTCELK